MQAGSGNKLYSIVIPTRERHDVLQHTIQTVLRQTRTNFEIVVMDNFSSPETKAVADQFASPHIRYVRAPERLTMTGNWELGLSHARGDYVSILGDDDGMLPDAVEVAEHLHAKWPDRALTWKPLIWFWPDFIRDVDRAHFSGHLSSRVEIRQTRDVLKRVLASSVNYMELPTLYYSFVPRPMIESIRASRGRYFGSVVPDIYSGMVNAISAPDYLYSFRPLSVIGISKHSTGMSSVYSEIDSTSFDLFKKEHGGSWDETLDPRLVGAYIPEVKIADGYLQLKRDEFPNDKDIEFDMPAFLHSLCRIASRYSVRHAEVEAAIQEMIVRNKLNPANFKVAPPVKGGELHKFSYSINRDLDLVNMHYYTNSQYVRTIDDLVANVGQMSVPAARLKIVDVRTGAPARNALPPVRRIVSAVMRRLRPAL